MCGGTLGWVVQLLGGWGEVKKIKVGENAAAAAAELCYK
jgi:hypothetical protein